MHRGYIKIWRKVKDSGLYQLPNAFTLFVYLLTEATYKTMRYGMIDLDRGQFAAGRYRLAAELGMSEQSVRTAIAHLHNLEMITSKSTNKFTVYTIVNYNNYQDEQPTTNQQINQPLTNHQPTTNQPTTTKQERKQESMKEETNKQRATRLPADWEMPAEFGNWALEEKQHWTNDDVLKVAANFKDWWIAAAGANACKLDWFATWRIWVRKTK